MKLSLRQKRLSHLSFQRNLLGGLCLSLLAISFVLSVSLFFKTEKTIVTPLELEQSYWVSGNRFSPNYLEEMALYYAHLLLDVTPSSLLYQGDVLLRTVDSEHYGPFKQRLFEDHQRLKKENLSLAFSPVECQVFPDVLSVEVTGDLMGYVASKRVSQHRETYRVVFSSRGSRLFLREFSLVATDKKEDSNESQT